MFSHHLQRRSVLLLLLALVDRCPCCACSGHIRTLPRLVKAPFQYATYAYKYLDVTKRLTKKPIKQAIITASALSLVYSPDLIAGDNIIENYSREQFLRDLINECQKDIRFCLGNIFSLTETFVEQTCDTFIQRKALTSFRWISPRRVSRSK